MLSFTDFFLLLDALAFFRVEVAVVVEETLLLETSAVFGLVTTEFVGGCEVDGSGSLAGLGSRAWLMNVPIDATKDEKKMLKRRTMNHSAEDGRCNLMQSMIVIPPFTNHSYKRLNSFLSVA